MSNKSFFAIYIMYLLFENWRRFINEEFTKEEEEYFGKSLVLGDQIIKMFQQFLKDTVIPKHPEPTIANVQTYLQFFTDDVEMKLGIKKLGCGKFRCGFDVGAKEIIKVDITPYGIGKDHNKDDFTLGTLSNRSNIFPKSFAHAPDFSWVLMEKVNPFNIKRIDEYVGFFPNSYLKLKNPTSQTKYYCILAAFMYSAGQYDNARRFLLRYVPTNIVDTNEPEQVKDMIDAFRGKTSGGRRKTYDDILKVIGQFNMRPDEVALRNTGTGLEDGRFVILDSSIESAILRGFAQKAPTPTPTNPAAGAETVKI